MIEGLIILRFFFNNVVILITEITPPQNKFETNASIHPYSVSFTPPLDLDRAWENIDARDSGLQWRHLFTIAVEEPADRDLPKTLKEDFKLFEATKKRSEYLENLFNAVMTAKPTSVESERSFSVGGGFATKIRSRLSDKSLSALVMLKMYFKSKRNQ